MIATVEATFQTGYAQQELSFLMGYLSGRAVEVEGSHQGKSYTITLKVDKDIIRANDVANLFQELFSSAIAGGNLGEMTSITHHIDQGEV